MGTVYNDHMMDQDLGTIWNEHAAQVTCFFIKCREHLGNIGNFVATL